MRKKLTLKNLNPQDFEAKVPPDLFTLWQDITKTAASQAFKAQAASFARLGTADEDMYTALTKLIQAYKNVLQQWKDAPESIVEVLSARIKEFEELPPTATNPIKAEKDQMLDNIWERIATGTSISVNILDDLHLRKTTAHYTQLALREYEELGNIIKIQIAQLEATDHNTDILNILRQVYQETGPIIHNFNEAIKSPKKPDVFKYEDFATEPTPTPAFSTLLQTEAQSILSQPAPCNKAALAALVQSNQDISQNILGVFTALQKDLQAPHNETELAILKGIVETIDIKIESLAENLQNFGEETAQLLADDQAPTLTPPSPEAIYSAWVQNPTPNLGELDIFANHYAPITKHQTQQQEKLAKHIFNFKKDVLLYEVSTYEEILTHSVARLQDTQLVALLQEAFATMKALLQAVGITPIQPAIKEAFNAFNHEVLMAEKQEGFAKGEIIKVLNTGYMENGKVIMRANVIAAR